MNEHTNICSLDYLIGTLATAYKGLISSLIARDFCIAEHGEEAIVRGTILSMPRGSYQASLMHQGRELSRTEIQEGFFELKTDSTSIRSARDLQLDIIQQGRHIGTFLLKSEKADTFFSPALELAEELRGINFKHLTAYLHDRIGLLRIAEDIIAKIVSTKKDWRKLSDDILTFSRDLFWVARPAYYGWYALFVTYSLKACEKLDVTGRDKPISNFLSLIELPLEEESDQSRLHELIDTWLRDMESSSVDLSRHARQSTGVFCNIHEKRADIDISHVTHRLIVSLEARIRETPAISDNVVSSMRDVISVNDQDLLSRYSERKKRDLLQLLSAAEAAVANRECGEILEKIACAASMIPDDAEITDTLFTVTERNLTAASGQRLLDALFEASSLFERLSPEGGKRVALHMARLIRMTMSLGMIVAGETLLSFLEKGLCYPREEIVLTPEVAEAILRAGDDALITRYVTMLKRIVIPIPRIAGFSSETWAEIVNPSHLERLAKFLGIIQLDSNRFRDVLIHVICNLYVSGIFLPDDRLFHREVSSYLNSESISGNFLLHYMLLQKLPVYYHDVGATGKLRDYTTEIDSWGNDAVLYFLRKQVHANASNYNVRLIEAIMHAWVYKNPEILKGVVPEDVLDKVDDDLLGHYAATMRTYLKALGALDETGLHLKKILIVREDDFNRHLEDLDVSDELRLKVMLLCRIYREVEKKYSPVAGFTEEGNRDVRLSHCIAKAKTLRGILLSSEKSEPEETLYFKRHIAFGIPSVMGSYHERRFDALGEALRNEAEIRVILESIISDIEEREKDFSLDDMRRWISGLEAMHELFKLHGLSNFQVDELLVILGTNTLRLSEIVDLLRMWQRELTWMMESLSGTFHRPLGDILRSLPEGELPGYLRRFYDEGKDFVNKAADVIIRDMVNSIAGFVELDRALDNIIHALSSRVEAGPDSEFRPEGAVEASDDYFVLDLLSNACAMRLSTLIGGKAKNLVYLRNNGILVPHGVVFSARQTRQYKTYTADAGFSEILKAAVQEIEKSTGTGFGAGRNPLFLSVRSGSYISMPGILSSILYCGMNGTTVRAFIEEKKNPMLGWDSYRRFIEHYATIVCGIDAVFFEDAANTFMKTLGIREKKDLSGEQMRQITTLFLAELAKTGVEIPEDVHEQLREAVKAIYRSWYSDKAEQFRKAMHISAHWGTSVTLMQMIYGNDRDSGTSVFFTRNPFSGERKIYGDTRERATGGDLVYGKYTNRPLSLQQGHKDQESLEEFDRPLFSLHERLGRRIEEVMGGLPQEVEATYTRGPDGKKLIYVLQTRRMELHRGFTKRFHDVCRMETSIIGHGIGVHGGALSGVASFSSFKEDIRRLKKESKLPVILLRKIASTDDVSLMPEIDGILAAAGGVASHASVLAQKFDLVAVVGCSDMDIGTDKKGEPYAEIGGSKFTNGTILSIDGSTGLVYAGLCTFTVETKNY